MRSYIEITEQEANTLLNRLGEIIPVKYTNIFLEVKQFLDAKFDVPEVNYNANPVYEDELKSYEDKLKRKEEDERDFTYRYNMLRKQDASS